MLTARAIATHIHTSHRIMLNSRANPHTGTQASVRTTLTTVISNTKSSHSRGPSSNNFFSAHRPCLRTRLHNSMQNV